MVDSEITEVIYCAPAITQTDMSKFGTNIKNYEGIPDMEMFSDQKPRLVILDDMMREADDRVVDIFTKGSHHCNHSVVIRKKKKLKAFKHTFCFLSFRFL